MTEKLFDVLPYETGFDAHVLNAENDGRDCLVILDRTLFFPEEGGQLADTGKLDGKTVSDVQIHDGVITHRVEKAQAADFPAGKPVHGEIDWEERFSRMQNHTGEHILSGLLHTDYGFENVGFHLGNFFVTLDTSGLLSFEEAKKLEEKANRIVFANLPVTASYPAPEELRTMFYRSKKEIDGPVRIVVIEGVDACACCAPHVRRTGEIGCIRILSAERMGDATRLTILCGARALAYANECDEALRNTAQLVSKPMPEAYDGVLALEARMNAQREEAAILQSAYVEAAAGLALSGGQTFPVVFTSPLPAQTDRRLMNRLLEGREGYAAVFTGDDEKGYRYLIGGRDADARIPGGKLKEAFGCKGGGKPDMVQGFVQASEEAIRKAIAAC